MNTPQEDSLRTSASLLGRLRDLDDSDSWSEFYHTYERVVRGLARKRGLTDAEAEEVAQEVFKRIAETIHTFERNERSGSFRRWLYQLARWRSDDKMRERGRITLEPITEGSSSRGTHVAHRVAGPDDPHQQLEADARRELLAAGLERIQRRVSARDLQIFQMLVLDETPAGKVAEFFGITTNSVYVVRHRVGQQLRTELDNINKRLDLDAGRGSSDT
ncbi:MAG: RNA polymerase sigma factor [Limisphaerales bacterium]